MTAKQYRAEAERRRDLAIKPWTLPDAREHLLDIAKIYESLAKATETLERQPIPI